MAKKSVFKYTSARGVMTIYQRANSQVLAVFTTNDYNEEILSKIFAYGHKQKIVDAASEGETAQERFEMMVACHEMLKSGKWELPREGGIRTVSVEIEAISRVLRTPIAATQKKWAETGDADRERYLKAPKVLKMIAQVREERAAAEEVDLDDLETATEEETEE